MVSHIKLMSSHAQIVAPFHVIHVGAAAPEIPPALVEQVSIRSITLLKAAGKTGSYVHTRRRALSR